VRTSVENSTPSMIPLPDFYLKAAIKSFDKVISVNIYDILFTVLWPHSTLSFYSMSSSASLERKVLLRSLPAKNLVYALMNTSLPCKQQKSRIIASNLASVSASLTPLRPFFNSLSQ